MDDSPFIEHPRTLGHNSRSQSNTSRCCRFVKHHRLHAYAWNFEWSLPDMKVEKHNFDDYPLQKQAGIIMRSRGILGATGASFSWQLWLPAMSMILVLTEPDTNQCAVWTCKYFPETWHVNPAFHLGHTAYDWHHCGGESAFIKAEPLSVFAFAVKRWKENRKAAMAETCVLFRARTDTPSWPWCDISIKMPAPCSPLPSHVPYNHVGVHYDVTRRHTGH
jgi:hypothetical protein